MSPIIPTSLLARSFCGTFRKTPSGCVSRASVTKTYFTPNRLRGGTHRPFVHHTFHPSLCHCPPPPTIPRPQHRFSTGTKPRREGFHHIPLYFIKLGACGALLSLTFLAAPVLYCDSTSPTLSPANVPPPKPQPQVASRPPPPPLPPPPQSSVNLYELTFGTVCGVCAGVFLKKGAKFVAFALGGVFVLLQYLGSLSIVRVDWNRAGSRFENLFYSTDALGVSRPPNVASLFRWLFDFLTADFQPRASFAAGFALGLRVG